MSILIVDAVMLTPRNAVRERITCSTPELSNRLYAYRESFQTRIWQANANPYRIKRRILDIMFPRRK
jgi:hypothetical protein